MPRKLSRNFFKQNGRVLNPQGTDTPANTGLPREAISTLSNLKPTTKELIFGYYTGAKEKLRIITTRRFIFSNTKWVGAAITLTIVFGTFVFRIPIYKHRVSVPDKYSLFSSQPLTLDSISQKLTYSDSRAVRIDSVFKAFNCPMHGLGEVMVREADANDIPYWVAAAIAFQESSCGKNTPEIDGVKTKNAWGWATYGENVYEFDNYEQGIQIVSKYLSKKFYSRGVNDLCEIMRTYTPPSNGSWCKGVEYFGDLIQSYKSPQNS